MTKAQVIESLEKDLERAIANRDRFANKYGTGDFANFTHYEGQVEGLRLALMTLNYLKE